MGNSKLKEESFMIVLFGTANIVLNNQIIEILEKHTGKSIQVFEADYLEEVSEKVWDVAPDLVILSDTINSHSVSNKGQKDIQIYNAILELKDFNVNYIVKGKHLTNPVIKKLLNQEFYSIVPCNYLETLCKVPTTKEEVERLLEDENFVPEIEMALDKKEVTEDYNAFVTPPTVVASPQTVEKAMNSYREESEAYLPIKKEAISDYISTNRPIVSLFWSPIPNVGVGSFIRILANTLAAQGRKVLMLEMDWEYPKLARQTALTHKTRNLKNALKSLLNGEKQIEDYVVNNQIAEDDLPHTHKQAKLALRELPHSLFALSRNAEISYEDDFDFDDDQLIIKLFYACKQAGFQHILVDVPSSPNNLFTSLAMLSADEKFLFVDDAFTTSGIYRNSMKALEELDITEDQFQLIINKTRDEFPASEIAEFYQMAPVLSLPFDEEMFYYQVKLQLKAGKEYMNNVNAFAKRYGVSPLEEEKKKKFSIFK